MSEIWIDPAFLDRTEFDGELTSGAPSRLRQAVVTLVERARHSPRLRVLLDALQRISSRDNSVALPVTASVEVAS